MKISRKAIAAVVATFALSTAGLSGTAFAEPGTGEPTPPTTVAECVGEVLEQFPDECAELDASEPQAGDDTETDDSPSTGSSEGFFDGSSDDDGNIDPKAISSWIAVFTAMIGALSTAFVFSQRIANA